ncbi:hypothetical protein M422DRAFT_24827 [Sphaerobolus stellatus SS14]|nr:hypothetical protein M422DRAFT_24827 [Sphaerobolus stellatus SS14]
MVYLGNKSGQCFAGTNDIVLPEIHLMSEISSIQSTEDIAVFTSFGPHPQIIVRTIASQEAYVIRPKQLFDVNTSRLIGRSLTLGMQKKALHIPDLQEPRDFVSLHTDSDVFALHCSNHEVWAGARNGCVTLFDLRTEQKAHVLDYNTLEGKRRTSIMHLNQIGDIQMLVTTISGEMDVFDMRMLRRLRVFSPVQSFKGHFNTYTTHLGHAVDPMNQFVFAAGEDHTVRGWSIATGQPLKAPLRSGWTGLLTRKFEKHVLCMQITSDGYHNKLWLTWGNELECYELGKRGVEGQS